MLFVLVLLNIVLSQLRPPSFLEVLSPSLTALQKVDINCRTPRKSLTFTNVASSGQITFTFNNPLPLPNGVSLSLVPQSSLNSIAWITVIEKASGNRQTQNTCQSGSLVGCFIQIDDVPIGTRIQIQLTPNFAANQNFGNVAVTNIMCLPEFIFGSMPMPSMTIPVGPIVVDYNAGFEISSINLDCNSRQSVLVLPINVNSKGIIYFNINRPNTVTLGFSIVASQLINVNLGFGSDIFPQRLLNQPCRYLLPKLIPDQYGISNNLPFEITPIVSGATENLVAVFVGNVQCYTANELRNEEAVGLPANGNPSFPPGGASTTDLNCYSVGISILNILLSGRGITYFTINRSGITSYSYTLTLPTGSVVGIRIGFGSDNIICENSCVVTVTQSQYSTYGFSRIPNEIYLLSQQPNVPVTISNVICATGV